CEQALRARQMVYLAPFHCRENRFGRPHSTSCRFPVDKAADTGAGTRARRTPWAGRRTMIQVSALVSILDLVGTFVFAISGASAAARQRLDVFGVLVVAFVAGNFGGITRDLLIGAVPPAALDDGRYLAVSL